MELSQNEHLTWLYNAQVLCHILVYIFIKIRNLSKKQLKIICLNLFLAQLII